MWSAHVAHTQTAHAQHGTSLSPAARKARAVLPRHANRGYKSIKSGARAGLEREGAQRCKTFISAHGVGQVG